METEERIVNIERNVGESFPLSLPRKCLSCSTLKAWSKTGKFLDVFSFVIRREYYFVFPDKRLMETPLSSPPLLISVLGLNFLTMSLFSPLYNAGVRWESDDLVG